MAFLFSSNILIVLLYIGLPWMVLGARWKGIPPKGGYCGPGGDPRSRTVTEAAVGIPPDQTSEKTPSLSAARWNKGQILIGSSPIHRCSLHYEHNSVG